MWGGGAGGTPAWRMCSVNPGCFPETAAGSRGAGGALRSLGLGATHRGANPASVTLQLCDLRQVAWSSLTWLPSR